MSSLRFKEGDVVDFYGECGHSLRVEDINFAASTDSSGYVAPVEENAWYYLRCQESGCARKYQWRIGYGSPRLVEEV